MKKLFILCIALAAQASLYAMESTSSNNSDDVGIFGTSPDKEPAMHYAKKNTKNVQTLVGTVVVILDTPCGVGQIVEPNSTKSPFNMRKSDNSTGDWKHFCP